MKTNYKEHSTEEIFRKLKSYLHNHDINSHIISVKEYTEKLHGLHYHILYFTNKQLDYSRLHSHMPSYADIHIQLVKKTKTDIENVLKYMNKTKKSHKSKSELMSQDLKPKISVFDFKLQSKTISEAKREIKTSTNLNKILKRLSIFDFKTS